MPTPQWFAQKRKEVYSLFEKIYSYTVGVNEFHNSKLLKLKQGILMKTIISHLRSQWIEYKQTGRIRRKFTAYSTQDWLILAFLHSLGCGKPVLGETVPNYNALVIIELYLQDKNRSYTKITK
ncbi:hypothetical protein OESDEN_19283 [Oesophagostomum dentatum]|uniref:Uncharacterized protein n=1 Tax=Oesophagostomum dentatum TaxID=61180 RepID=A0A0B1SCT3_OESDE|nr:hypothetical protein OESDEN_19283 [Oesophagostomum dentatum]